MTLVPKDWVDAPSTTTPISAAALEDLETRLGAYTDGARQTIDVTDSAYGALGDGAADDTAEIQAAINASVGAVFFPAGTYLVSSDITIPSGRMLYGEGPSTIIKRTGATAGVGFTNSDLTNGNTDITIRNLTVDRTQGNDALAPSDNCINFRYVTRGHIEGVHTKGAMKGIHLQGCLETLVRGCHTDLFRDNGIAINDPAGIGGTTPTDPQVIVADCIVNLTAATKAAAGSSPVIITSANTMVTGCQIKSTVVLGGSAIELGIAASYQPDNCRIERNVVVGGAILVGAGDRHVVQNNLIEDGTLAGSAIITVQAVASGTPTRISVANNTVVNGGAAGASAIVLSAPFSSCCNNIVRGGARIYAQADDISVYGNLIEDGEREGIRVAACNRPHVRDNFARNCGVESGGASTDKVGFIFDSMVDPVVEGNLAHSSLAGPADMKYGYYMHNGTNVIWRDNRSRGHTTGVTTVTGTQSWEARGEMPSIASAATLLLTEFSDAFDITGTATINTITATGMAGKVKVLKFASTAAVSEAGNVKLVGTATFTASADDTLTLVSDGTSWFEMARSVN